MGQPVEHAVYLNRTGFPIPECLKLTERERTILNRYGHWMRALVEKQIDPNTPEQCHFVGVARGELDATSEFERLWMKCVDAKRPTRLTDHFARLVSAREAVCELREEYVARRDELLAPLREQLAALEAEFAGRIAETQAEAARIEAETRAAVLAHGAGFSHAGIRATVARPRISWDNTGMAAYLETHPEVAVHRRVGKPVVALRFDTPVHEVERL